MNTLPTLNESPCLLRPWREEDVPALAAIANNRKIARNLTHTFPHPYTEADAHLWVGRCLRGEEPYAWAIEAAGELAGGLGIHRGQGIYAHSALIGYWLGESFWGRGIASAALAAGCHDAFDEIGLTRLHSMAFAWNPASMRVLEKNGFTREGIRRSSALRFGEVVDEVLYGRLRTS